MKIRTVRRGIVILCLMCILAACARESAPAEGVPTVDAAVAASVTGPDRPGTGGEWASDFQLP